MSMTAKQFFIQLAAISALAALSLLLLHQVSAFQGHNGLSWGSWLGFILMTILLYYAGLRSARSANKNDFSNTVLGFSMGKMMLAALSLVVYAKVAQPTNKLFIIPFFAIYAIFTVFETIVMTKLGRTSS